MANITKSGAQGDVLLIRVEAIPQGLPEIPRVCGQLIVTHSETGHHHVIERPHVTMYQDPDPLVAWLEVHDVEDLPQVADLIHERSWDTHETLGLATGLWQVRRQREEAPTGYRKVQD